jgi:curved DNA binding protein
MSIKSSEIDPSLENTPANPKVLNKFQAAAELANKALLFSIDLCKVEAPIHEICKKTDAYMQDLLGTIYKDGKTSKGIAFPTSISPNGIVCHYSPADDTDEPKVLIKGDLVKIELGIHIDDFPALVGTTLCIGGEPSEEQLNLISAAHLGAELYLRQLKDGVSNEQVSRPILDLCADFGVNFIEGLMSHQVAQKELAAGTIIVPRPNIEQRKLVTPAILTDRQVFVIDVALSSKDGMVKPSGKHRTTIFRKSPAKTNPSLRSKSAKAFYSQIGSMAFHLSHFEKSRISLPELLTNKALEPYEVMMEKEETAITARFMFTCILTPTGPIKITDYPHPTKIVSTPLRAELKSLLEQPVRKEKKKTSEA